MPNSNPKQEPPDHEIYPHIWFRRGTVEFMLVALHFYETLLRKDIEAIDSDPDLKAILGREQRESFAVDNEVKKLARWCQWLNEEVSKLSGPHDDPHISMSHGSVRFIKSIVMLYINHLGQRRNLLAARPNISKHVLEAVDQRIAGLRETLNLGVFKDASPVRLLADELASAPPDASTPPPPALSKQELPRPVLIESIEIRDPSLRT